MKSILPPSFLACFFVTVGVLSSTTHSDAAADSPSPWTTVANEKATNLPAGDRVSFQQSRRWQRAYGRKAPWNVPVKNIPHHPESTTYVDRLYNNGKTVPGRWILTLDDWTYPVYRVTPELKVHRVQLKYPTWGNLDGEFMPWSPSWLPAAGSDGQAIVLDPSTGREWCLWQVAYNPTTRVIEASSGSLIPGSYWTKEDAIGGCRGSGIQTYAMLTEAEEIAAGDIRHALPMVIPNTDGCSYVAPAAKLEHPNAKNCNGVPQGMRFALNITDADIDAWLADMPAPVLSSTKASARKIAQALRDYGFFIVDTGGATHIQLEDHITGGGLWKTLGMHNFEVNGKAYPARILDGLITQSRIYALVPSDQYPPNVYSHAARDTHDLDYQLDVTAAPGGDEESEWTAP